MSRAVIIGAGVAGLTAGVSLSRRGWDVEVLERAEALRPVGVAFILAPNALRALHGVSTELVDELTALSAIQGVSGIRDGRGRWLTRDDPQVAIDRYGYPAVAVRRSTLISLLASHLPAGSLRLRAEVVAVDAPAGSATLRGGDVLSADLLVAADGIHSSTRAGIWPEHPGPVFLGSSAWQTVIPGEGLEVTPGITWAANGEIGVLQLVGGDLYMFANAAASSPVTPQSGADAKASLQRLFGSLYSPIPEFIDRCEPALMVRTDIYGLRLPLPALHSGRTAMLGDAAHAMAPNLGQGACQAIEDAVTLAYSVAEEPNLDVALASYTAARLPRTTLIARRSLQVMRLATARNPLVRAFRDALVRASALAGPSAALRQADFVMTWDHPVMSEAG